MIGPDAARWRVGELAEATGLTVRTLHHYDKLGPLVVWGATAFTPAVPEGVACLEVHIVDDAEWRSCLAQR